MRSPPPVSGAWRPGDPPGRRQFLQLPADRSFALEGGGALRDVDHRLRDLGHARRTRRQRRPRLPRLDRRQPRRRTDRARAPDARAGGRAWSARAGRSTPTATSSCAPTCSAAARARPARRRPTRRPAARTGRASRWSPIRDMVRAQARLADHLGVAGVAQRDRRLDGRDAGARVGRSCSPTGSRSLVPVATTARRPPPSRSPGAPSAAGPSGSTPAGGAATTTTPSRATARTRAWPSPAMLAQVTFRTDDVFTDRFGRELADARRRRLRAVAALRGRALPRPPRRQARAPVRRQLLPAAVARRWTSTTSAGAGAASRRRWPASRCRRWRSASGATCSTRRYQQTQIRELLAPQRHAGRVRRDRLAARPRRFLLDVDQVGAAVVDVPRRRGEG